VLYRTLQRQHYVKQFEHHNGSQCWIQYNNAGVLLVYRTFCLRQQYQRVTDMMDRQTNRQIFWLDF